MRRLEPMAPESLDPEQAALYESIALGPRAQGPQHFALTAADGSLLGPFNALLLSPALGGALQEVGARVRYGSSLTPRTREMAILAVAAHWSSTFERDAHESVGRAVGLNEREIDDLRAGHVPDLDDRHEHACARLVAAMLRDGDVDDETWATSARTVGPRTVFELTTLVGYYATLALQMRVFRVD